MKFNNFRSIFYIRPIILICTLLAAITIAAYWQLPDHDFVDFDDKRLYLQQNQYVKNGLTSEGVKWAFTTTHAEFWHPLTLLSFMLDVHMFGVGPSGFLFTNLLLHIANTLILFLVLNQMTGAMWRSSFVAALFALHPLHVESVAWIAARKEVLSAFFWMLTLWGYTWFVKTPCIKRYLLMALFFILGLMAKPMPVTLPFVLLLLDYWPLRRFQCPDSSTSQPLNFSTSRFLRLIIEKIPLVIIGVLASAVAIYAQQSRHGLGTLAKYPLIDRLANAICSYMKYMEKMIWPENLAAFYPYPDKIDQWQVISALCLLIVISLASIKNINRHPYLIVGWLWYLGTLVPVLGLIQVGAHSMADRYTYVPLIGLFIMIAWGAAALVPRWPYRKAVISIMSVFIILILVVTTRIQVGYWKNGLTLFLHAIETTENNYLAHYNVACTLAEQNRTDEALRYYASAIQIKPDYAEAYTNMGIALEKKGKFKEAIAHYQKALQIKPHLTQAYSNLGNAYLNQGKLEEAIASYTAAVNIKADSAEFRYNLGTALLSAGRTDKAMSHFFKALQIDPKYADAYNNLGAALLRKGMINRAIEAFRSALILEPGNANIRNNLKKSLALQNKDA